MAGTLTRLQSLVVLASLLMASTWSFAQPGEQAVCIEAQAIIATTDLVPELVVHDNHEVFVEAKPADEPFTIHQYSSAPLAADNPLPTVVSCKLRTAERINTAHDDAGGAVPVASAETSCDEVHRRMLEAVYTKVAHEEQALPQDAWKVEAEDMKFIGPQWLEPWPFVSVTRASDATLTLHTRALYAPHAWWIPMPERFMGNYYCHLVHPRYLEAVVRGEVSVP
jgi:hypothetical protein